MGRSVRVAIAAVVGAVVLALGACTATPAITATPDNVMVNTTITLAGSGFPASATIQLEECGATSWAATDADPCVPSGEIDVATSSTGTFSIPFKAVLCPRVGPIVPPVTEVTCYVGEPSTDGSGNSTLVGAAKVIVTYP